MCSVQSVYCRSEAATAQRARFSASAHVRACCPQHWHSFHAPPSLSDERHQCGTGQALMFTPFPRDLSRVPPFCPLEFILWSSWSRLRSA